MFEYWKNLRVLLCLSCLGSGLVLNTESKPRQRIIVYLKTPISPAQKLPKVSFLGLAEQYGSKGHRGPVLSDLESQKTYQAFLKNQKTGNPYVEYRVVEGGQVRLDVLDLYGKKLATLVDQVLLPGTYRIDGGLEWNKLVPVRGLILLSLSVNGSSVYSEKVFKLKW